MKSASYLGLPRRSPLDPLSLAYLVHLDALTIATAQDQNSGNVYTVQCKHELRDM